MKFLPGNPGGPGRPKRSTEEKYLKKLTSTVTIQEWKEVILTAVEQAKGGDAQARRWLSEYLMGRPQPIPEQARQEEDTKIVIEWIDVETGERTTSLPRHDHVDYRDLLGDKPNGY